MKKYEKQRNQLVVKSNDLVQKSRHKLTANQQLTLFYVISMIKPNATENDLEYEFQLTDYLKTRGLTDGSENYATVRKTLGQLTNIQWEMTDAENDMWTRVSWINKVKGSQKKGTYNVRLDEDLMPFLIQLKNNFTQYQLINILTLTSGYAIQLYEILRSYEWTHQWVVSCDEFREQLYLTQKTYDNWGELKRRVIDVALKQINEKTDLDVFYKDNGGRGKKTTRLAFIINFKKTAEVIEVKKKVNEELNCFDPMSITEIDDSLLDWINENKQSAETVPAKERKQAAHQIKHDELVLQYQKQLEYDLIAKSEKFAIKDIDEWIAIMVDVELSQSEYITVNREKKAKAVVVSQFHKLTTEHVEYILWCLRENVTGVKNIRGYLLTTLFNAPSTINNWYQQRVNHDMYGEQ